MAIMSISATCSGCLLPTGLASGPAQRLLCRPLCRCTQPGTHLSFLKPAVSPGDFGSPATQTGNSALEPPQEQNWWPCLGRDSDEYDNIINLSLVAFPHSRDPSKPRRGPTFKLQLEGHLLGASQGPSPEVHLPVEITPSNPTVGLQVG